MALSVGREIEVFRMSDDWEKWQRSLDIYFTANSITNDEIKLAKLLHYGGIELQDLFYILPGAYVEKLEDNDVYKIAVDKLKDYFAPKRSTAFERHVFFGLFQNEEESVEQFAYRLRKQASKCKFKNDVDEYIRDQITSKTNNEKLRVHILKHDELTLDQVLAQAKALEAVTIQKEAFKKPIENTYKIDARLKTFKRNVECFRCGRNNHDGNDPNCPARNQKCNKCNFFGHYELKCRTNRTNKRTASFFNQGNVKRARYEPKNEMIRAIDRDDDL